MLAQDKLIQRLRAGPANTAALRAERKRISKELAGVEGLDLVKLANDSIAAGVARFVAYELVLNHSPTMKAITPEQVEKLGQGMRSWSDVDSFACIVSGRAWRAGRIGDGVIKIWARSDDWCWRRVALVSTVPLNSRAQGGDGDAKRTLDICGMLVADRHDLVVKAMSWALRELGKRDPESVRGFLSMHRDEIAARVVREVNSKLLTGLKNPRKARGARIET
jgi:3-methyladenine DNA glycosylase AlkD